MHDQCKALMIRVRCLESNRRRRGRSGLRISGTPRATAPPPVAEPAAVVRPAPRVERLAYTRSQAAEALGLSRSTFARRVLPYVETIETSWGARLIPVDELDRLVAERRRPAKQRPTPSLRGRPRQLPAEVVDRIQAAHAAGQTPGGIARELNADRVPTAQGGRQWWPSTVRAVLNR
jgi:Recombinase